MSRPQGRKGPRRVEVTGPEQDQSNGKTEETEQAAECPFIPGEAEEPAGIQQAHTDEQSETAVEQTAALEAAIGELEERCAYAEDQHLRVVAELQNYKRRVQKEKDQLIRYATEGLVTELVPVLDNFERAMEVEVDSPGAECLMAGVKMIYEQLHRVLEAQGVEAIEALGETFDPNMHEAVEREETNALPPDVIVAEISRGYRVHDRVIRPSKVRVTVRPKDESSEEESEAE